MGRAIGLTIVGMLLFFGYSWLIFIWGAKIHEGIVRKNDMAGVRGLNVIKEAAKILGRLGVASTLDDVEIISSKNQQAIKEWLEKYNQYQERVK